MNKENYNLLKEIIDEKIVVDGFKGCGDVCPFKSFNGYFGNDYNAKNKKYQPRSYCSINIMNLLVNKLEIPEKIAYDFVYNWGTDRSAFGVCHKEEYYKKFCKLLSTCRNEIKI